jgi:uncharacterized OB-fold protein
MTARVPIVDYLVLEPEPHLVAQQCRDCGARYFDRRVACASCFSTAGFDRAEVAAEGELTSFTIVAFAPPGVETPYVAGIVDCDGTAVRSNVVNVAQDPEHVTLGMKVRLTTFSLGTDDEGTEAIGFGFAPVGDAA